MNNTIAAKDREIMKLRNEIETLKHWVPEEIPASHPTLKVNRACMEGGPRAKPLSEEEK